LSYALRSGSSSSLAPPGFFLLFDHQLLSPSLTPAISIAVFLWLFAAVVIGALTVVANADELAVILGEPYGTLILTLSVGSIEIMTICHGDAHWRSKSSTCPHGAGKRMTLARHTAMMMVFLGTTVLLAEKLAVTLNTGLETFGLPPALGALLVAILVLVPEGVGAIEAALANLVQRSMNILLGSVLATLAMTIPAVIIVAMVGHTTLELGLSPSDQVMLVLTLLTSMLTFSGGRTNVLQGTVHLGLFLAYLLLIFIP
jgi:Ca2+/H+ antiporter